jgi:hypothetical protein
MVLEVNRHNENPFNVEFERKEERLQNKTESQKIQRQGFELYFYFYAT